MHQTAIFLTARCSTQADVRQLQRRAQNNELIRIHKGVYVEARTSEELIPKVRSNWQEIAGAIAPGAVISNLSAMTSGLLPDNSVYLSHPTLNRKQIQLPGLTLVLLQGPGPLPGDLPLGSTGLHWAGRSRFLLENIGRNPISPSVCGLSKAAISHG